MAAAQEKLAQLQLADEQRAVASRNATTTIDNAIEAGRQLFNDLDRFRTEVVPGVRSSYYLALQRMTGHANYDQDAIGDYAVRDALVEWGDREGLAFSAIRESLEEADRLAQALTRIRDEELMINKPIAVAMTRDRVDSLVVDNWNEQALKTLKEGTDTVFYEIGDLVIIDAKQPRDQPYLDWARQQPQIRLGAKITMTKKGGAFDSGKITAVDVQNRASFEAAIKRVSNKKVEY